MKLVVLGAAAGGGVPQWNAATPNNLSAFAADGRSRRLTQCSLAVTDTGDVWVVMNASPDIREQIIATPELHPRTPPRSSPISAVVLTGADVDAIAGLLTLRERQKLAVWATAYVLDVLRRNPIFHVLNPDFVSFHEIELGSSFHPIPGLTFAAFETPGKPPLYLETEQGIQPKSGAAIGLSIRDQKERKVTFVPACSEVIPAVQVSIANSDVAFFDGTMFSDEEMIRSGEGTKTSRRMGHIPMQDTIRELANTPIQKRLFIHINNSNPALLHDSPERLAVVNAGWDLAQDGMRIEV